MRHVLRASPAVVLVLGGEEVACRFYFCAVCYGAEDVVEAGEDEGEAVDAIGADCQVIDERPSCWVQEAEPCPCCSWFPPLLSDWILGVEVGAWTVLVGLHFCDMA